MKTQSPAKIPPFKPVKDSERLLADPMLSRMFECFDALRKRNVGPDRCAYVIAQVWGIGANGGSHPQK